MTRKHFEMAAKNIAAMKNETISERKKLAENWIKVFAAPNPRFDRSRFMTACGLN